MAKRIRTKAEQEIHRMWGDTPIVDADAQLIVAFNKQDLSNANPLNPSECVFAQACKRMYGSGAVLFFRTVAYIELLDEKGNKIIKRFSVPTHARRVIEEFDTTGTTQEEGGFTLAPPAPCFRLDNKVKQNRKYRKDLKEGKVQARRGSRPNAGRRPKPVKMQGLRQGVGVVAMHVNHHGRTKS